MFSKINTIAAMAVLLYSGVKACGECDSEKEETKGGRANATIGKSDFSGLGF